MSGKTVFLSYRRDTTGKAVARVIQQALTQRGYDVFLDVDSMDPGRWEEQLLREVPARAHFLLLLTPGALEPCGDPKDWVRREYELAVAHERNVVPVRDESFDTDRERADCPDSMRSVFGWQIADVRHASFVQDIEELVRRFIAPHHAPRDSSAAPSSTSSRPRIAASKLPAGGELLIGREAELGVLDDALADAGTHIVEFVAWGGVGKSALAVEWTARLAANDWPGIECYFDWSFYSQGTRDQSAVSADVFIAEALAFFGDPDPQAGAPHDRGDRLAELVARQPTVLILDGIEPLQYGTGPLKGQLKDPALLALLKGLARRPFSGLCVATTREELTDLKSWRDKTVAHNELQHLNETAGAALLHRSGATRRGAADIAEDNDELRVASREVKGHALTLSLLGGYLKLAHLGDIDRRDRVRFEKAAKTQGGHAFRVVAAYEHWFESEDPSELRGDPERGRRMLAVPTWEPSRTSSSCRGAASHPRSRKPTKGGC